MVAGEQYHRGKDLGSHLLGANNEARYTGVATNKLADAAHGGFTAGGYASRPQHDKIHALFLADLADALSDLRK